ALDSLRIRLNPSLSVAMCERILSNSYEREERGLVSATLSNDDVVVEIGAGLGVISTICAKRLGSHRVFAYEANPALETFIRDTHELNDVSPSLSICLLGKTAGSSEFWLAREFWASSTVRPDASAECIRVPVVPLNDEMRRIRPTYLILDIEGGELELFEFIELT